MTRARSNSTACNFTRFSISSCIRAKKDTALGHCSENAGGTAGGGIVASHPCARKNAQEWDANFLWEREEFRWSPSSEGGPARIDVKQKVGVGRCKQDSGAGTDGRSGNENFLWEREEFRWSPSSEGGPARIDVKQKVGVGRCKQDSGAGTDG